MPPNSAIRMFTMPALCRRAPPSRRHVKPSCLCHRGEAGGVVHGDEAWGAGDRQGAIVDAHPPERVEGNAEQMAEIDADHAAVRDDEHVLAVPMVRGDPTDRLEHPGADVGERLAPP